MTLSPAPKNPIANIRYRRAIIERCLLDDDFKHEVWMRAARDIIWWIDTFAWTYSPKDYPSAPNRPFILYKSYQEPAILKINDAIGKHNLLIEKSRDMGATWKCMAVFGHRWIFHPRQSFLVGSRKEELVDKTGDTKTLFWKLDYLLEHLPGWMRPNMRRNTLHIENLDNGSVIDGESTNDDFARGDRRTAILLDEFPAVENGHSILRATRDATNCRIFNGTPQGATGAYYQIRQNYAARAPERIIRLHWSEHPEKSVGLYSTVGREEGGKLEILDLGYKFPVGYKFTRDGKLRSPWYDAQCLDAANPQEIAQELDINYAGSGWRYFEEKLLERLINEQCRPPMHVGEFTYDEKGRNPQWLDQPGGRVKLWVHPDALGYAQTSLTCSVGCDVAMGTASSLSSNSVLSAVNKTTGEKVVQFTSNSISPEDFGVYAVAICRWLNGALLIWETNGPGGQFTKSVDETGYRNVFYSQDEKLFGTNKTRKPGWGSTKDSKRILMGNYARALINGTYINRCEEALKECGEYVHGLGGIIYHVGSDNDQDPTSSGENHGDMVIADALANRGISEVSKPDKPDSSEVPPGSFLERRLESQKKITAKDYY